MHFDLLIVGGGPAGLAAAIRAKQLAHTQGRNISVCLIDKGAEIGAHIISGAIIDPRPLEALLPDWRARGAPLSTQVAQDEMMMLSQAHTLGIPAWLRPACLDNTGLYIGSLGQLCRWLAVQAEALGVEIYPGIAASYPLLDSQQRLCGVMTGEMGRLRNGSEGPAYIPGTPLLASYTLVAEGARGNIGKQLEKTFNLRAHAQPQTFSLGFKELWQTSAGRHIPGLALHTGGWPLNDTVGGGFLYHYGEGLISVGIVMSLGYRNPWLSPYEEFQRLKNHPALRKHLEGATRLAYGARVLASGGPQSLPELVFPGGALIGDVAGFLDPARLKGIHGAIASGMFAAEAAVSALGVERTLDILDGYPEQWFQSGYHQELVRSRNFKPSLALGRRIGPMLAGIDQVLLRGHAPWTLRTRDDHSCLEPIDEHPGISYPKPDGIVSFTRSDSLHLSNVRHTEDQPCHLRFRAANLSIELNLPTYAAPEQRYCPAGVYEVVHESTGPRLQVNATNCLHCKACDIKDPTQNIEWTPPQGGEGPLYTQM